MVRAGLIPAGLASLLFSAIQVSAHGIADGITLYKKGETKGTYYKGYNPSYQYEHPPPEVAAWSTPDDLQNGFVAPAAYANADIICHLGASPSALEVPVTAGDTLAIHWNTWPDSHKGPIIDALAKCDGACSDADKTKLKFFKIGEQAQLDKSKDFWAPNQMIQNDFTWFITIPEGIAPGNYVLRHEIIALHAALQPGGAQNYPFCFSLAITSSGTDNPEGSGVTSWYKSSDKGILWDLFSQQNQDYPIVGPNNLYSGVVKASQRKPNIGATALAIKSLDPALLAAPTPKVPLATTQPAPVATTVAPAPVMTPPKANPVGQPTMIPPAAQQPGGPVKVYTTLRVTTFVTSVKTVATTQYTTVMAPRPN